MLPDLATSSNTDTQRPGDIGIIGAATPKQGIARHYTSLKEHAFAVQYASLTPGGGHETPPVERRRGFTWEFGGDEEPGKDTPPPHRSPTPRTPPTLEELCTKDLRLNVPSDEPPEGNNEEPLSRTSTRNVSSGSSSLSLSRITTARSSISGLARGMRRHIPNTLMYSRLERKPGKVEQEIRSNVRPKVYNGWSTKFGSTPIVSEPQFLGTAPKPVNRSPKPNVPSKPTLKDRRNLAQADALKISLPPNMAELPSRGRSPIIESSSIVPPRRRSPKTPLATSVFWHHSSPQTAPATIIEDDEPPLLTRAHSATMIRTPRSHISEIKASWLFSLGRSRWRQFIRRSNPNSPNLNSFQHSANPTSPKSPKSPERESVHAHPGVLRSRLSSSRSPVDKLKTFLQPRKLQSSPSDSISMPLERKAQQLSSHNSHARGKLNGGPGQSTGTRIRNNMDHMPTPSSFIPPGLIRTPTPPISDPNTGVSTKLAEFFFDPHAVREIDNSNPTGSIWDSDALLMSQNIHLESSHSEGDDSSQGPSGSPLTINRHTPSSVLKMPRIGTYMQPTLPHYLAPVIWDRSDADSLDPEDPTARAAEEKARLEWLTPEHLPSSPLCPLHEKYKGASKGHCVYHGRSSFSEARAKAGGGQTGRRSIGERGDSERSRSLTQRSDSLTARKKNIVLDGSEDTETEEGGSGILVSATMRRKRRTWWPFG